MSNDFQVRQQEWDEAANAAKLCLSGIRVNIEEFLRALQQLEEIAREYDGKWRRSEEHDWGNDRSKEKLGAVRSIYCLDTTLFQSILDDEIHKADDVIDVALRSQLPRGYGRD